MNPKGIPECEEHYIHYVGRCPLCDPSLERQCPRCGGAGAYSYASTSTWRGGVGGAMFTPDVCDLCWGSGDENNPGENLKLKP